MPGYRFTCRRDSASGLEGRVNACICRSELKLRLGATGKKIVRSARWSGTRLGSGFEVAPSLNQWVLQTAACPPKPTGRDNFLLVVDLRGDLRP